jgi:poly-gamma-glutamate synthesis protein (capsule biosynthesis protein)
VNGTAYFLQNVKSILEADDVTFANLEGPLTTSADKTTTGIYAFKGDPSYTEVLESGSVEVVTLANNHTNDYGSQGLEDTKENLKEAGIDYCVNDEICIREVNGIRMAFIGIYELNEGIECESRVRSTIEDAKQQGAQLVIVAFHWGTEKANYPDETQQSLAHTAIDCGADLVLGHHPHVLQGIEKYNGKYIVYSLANFCFGGNSAPSDMDTIIFQQTFTVTRDSVLSDDEITVIPCSVSSVSGYNNYQPTPATGSEAERILQRLDEYSSQFGQTSFASEAADTAE